MTASSGGNGGAPRTMAAAVVVEPGRVAVNRVAVPEPGSGQVRVRLEGCGVCASNLPPWEGKPWFSYPLAPGQLGHEGWGSVDAVGPGVGSVAPGDRVAMLSDHAYAEYDVCAAEAVVPLPVALDGAPFPGEPLGCAMNVMNRSGVSGGQTVAVVGIGFLGALLTRLAHLRGARVIAISRRACALDAARAMGAEAVVALDEHRRVIDRVTALTGGAMCPCVIEATGHQWPLDLAAELTGERGRLVIAGYHQDGPRQVNMQLWNWRGLDVINAHERDLGVYTAGMRSAMAAVVAGDLDPTPLYTHRFSLEQVGVALDMTRDRPDGFMKALIVA